MLLNKIEDPRDNLDKAHRLELVRFAVAAGMREITEQMPAIVIRGLLRAKGLTNIRVPPRPLGAQNQPGTMPAPGQRVAEVDAAADLARQFQAEQAPPKRARPPKYPQRLVERPKQEINILRDRCKELGIHMDRRDRKEDLKRKIEAHGKDAAAVR